MSAGSFEEVWVEMERKGYQYGRDALEQVRLGWEMAKAQIPVPVAACSAEEAAWELGVLLRGESVQLLSASQRMTLRDAQTALVRAEAVEKAALALLEDYRHADDSVLRALRAALGKDGG